MIEILRELDDVAVLISGIETEILDAGEDFVLAEASLEELGGETAGNFPSDLTIQIHSEDGFGTYFFHELEILAVGGKTAIDFVCRTPNKYWEGHYGLAAFIQSISLQSKNVDNFEAREIETEDDWKTITMRRILDDGNPIRTSVITAAETLNNLIRQAEIALGGLAWRDVHFANEDLFCREILEPLLRRMGFLFVRYTHGRREYGKDFTFSEQSTFGSLRHYGLQAKAGDVSGAVNAQVDELIGQVNDAFAMPFYELGSADRRFISTFVIAISGHFTENAREKIVEKIPATLLGSIWFLDRTRIDELVQRYWQKTGA